MATVRLFRCTMIVTLFRISLSEIWFVPTKTFLQCNKTDLRCYGQIDDFHFRNDFQFYRNGEPLKGEGGAPTTKVKDEPLVYYELMVDQPGVYTCIVAEENVTAEVYEPPDVPLPLVSEIGDHVNISCPNGPTGSESKLEITDKGRERLKITNSNNFSISNTGFGDVFRAIQCNYRFPSDNRTVTISLHLIVLKIEIDDKSSEMYTVICAAYSNLTDISITLNPHGKGRVYSNSNFVSDDLNGNISNVTCSVWYKSQEVWSTVISTQENYSTPVKQTGVSVCLIASIIEGIIIVVGISGMLIYFCKTKTQETKEGVKTEGRKKVEGKKDNKDETFGLMERSYVS